MKKFLARAAVALLVLVVFVFGVGAPTAQAFYEAFGSGSYTATADPYITSLSSPSGSAGQTISIYGSNFTTAQCVLFSNGTTANKTDVSSAVKTFTVPSTLGAGTYSLKIAGSDCLFFGMSGASSNSVSFTVLAGTVQAPTVTFSASPTTITSGQYSLLSWSTKNAQRCVLTYGSTQISAGVGGSEYVYPTQTTTYKLWCANDPGDGKDGPSTEKSVTVTVGASTATSAPVISLTASPSSIGTSQSSVLTWSTQYADGCALQTGYVLGGSYTETSIGLNGSKTVSPTKTTTYRIYCTNSVADGKSNPPSAKTVTVTVGSDTALSPDCTLSTNKSSYVLGDVIKLSWTTSRATSVSFIPDNSGKDSLTVPTGTFGTSGSVSIDADGTGSPVVSMMVYGASGKSSCSKTIRIGSTTAASLQIANPLAGHTWTLGDTQTFRWSTTGLPSNGTGRIDLVRNGVIYKIADITNTGSYRWSNLGIKGSPSSLPAGEYSVKILINDIGDIIGPLTLAEAQNWYGGTAPTITASISPSSIDAGDRAKITWSARGAKNCTLSYGSTAKSIGVAGSRNVSPSVTTAYEIRCEDSSGASASKMLTLTVGDVISGDADIDPRTISSCVDLRSDLGYRMSGTDVSTLQDYLQSKGYLNSEPTGYFGLMTQAAVKSFQIASGVSGTGYVGPLTRAKIKAATCN
jgi:hypothetical protein